METVLQRNRVTIGSNGKPVFFIDGVITSRAKYEAIMGKYKDPVVVETPAIDPNCVFCGEVGVRSKFVNMRTVRLCENDWQNKTTGEVAAVMKA